MIDEAVLEQRLEHLEHAVADLQQRLAGVSASPNWLDQITGSISDEPAFLEALEFGRAFRTADRPRTIRRSSREVPAGHGPSAQRAPGFLQRQAGPEYTALAARITQHSPTDLAFSVISFHEQTLGAHTFISRARTTADVVRGYALLLEIIQGFSVAPVLPFDAAAAAVFDDLRAQRVRVATMDLCIAAIALSRGLVLLTRNLRDFSRVPGLAAEDWTA